MWRNEETRGREAHRNYAEEGARSRRYLKRRRPRLTVGGVGWVGELAKHPVEVDIGCRLLMHD